MKVSTSLENILAISVKLYAYLPNDPANPLPGIYLREMKTIVIKLSLKLYTSLSKIGSNPNIYTDKLISCGIFT